jgi:DNA invertase Pin-like site-specific DNA recombinase
MKTAPLAYSYVRFSTREQREGDSLRRQTEAAEAWCKRHGVRLDTSTTLHDLGKSAFTGEHRKNADRHALAGFLRLVESGKVPRGSYLVIENLDRLSREHIQPALLLALNLLQAGVRIVQLKPAEMVFDDKSDTLPVMMMMMELSRGHGESAIKSERVGKAWAEKKRRGRERGEVVTRQLPGWVEEHGGKLRLIPVRAAVVRRIFEMAIAGYGLSSIVRRLTEEKVPPFGKTRFWVRSYVAHILKDRRALGEFQPRMRRGRAPDGDAITGYFPAVVSEEEWSATRAGAAQRRRRAGRVGAYINLFSCLTKNAKDGDPMTATMHKSGRPVGKPRTGRRVLRNKASMEGRAPGISFPLETFERAVLSLLAEIDPEEILKGDREPDESLVLAGELARVEGAVAAITADLDRHGESPTLYRRLREKEALKADLARRLAAAREKAASPLSEAWVECRTLLSALDAAPDPQDARLRLRAVLRRMIESVWMLIVPRGRTRLCAVQIWFAGEKKRRDFLILHHGGVANGIGRNAARWWARSLAGVAPDAGGLDLRKPADAARLETALVELDLYRDGDAAAG